MKVYKRTSEGQWAAFDEHSPLPRKLKILLKAINGKVAEDIYVKNLSSFGDVQALLSSLEQVGLIFDRSQAGTKLPVVQPQSASPPATSAQHVAMAAPDLPAPLTGPAAPTAPVPMPGLRRPSPVVWQTLPELTELTEVTQANAGRRVREIGDAGAVAPAAFSALARPELALREAPAARPGPTRAPPVLTDVYAASEASRVTHMDALAALADLADLAGQSAPAVHTSQASNILTHNALLAANDEPSLGVTSKRASVRHAVELMSNFVLDHMPRTASQVLPEIESVHSVDQWAELMDGYAAFIAPTGERGHNHLAQLRRMLNAAFEASDISAKGWYA